MLVPYSLLDLSPLIRIKSCRQGLYFIYCSTPGIQTVLYAKNLQTNSLLYIFQKLLFWMGGAFCISWASWCVWCKGNRAGCKVNASAMNRQRKIVPVFISSEDENYHFTRELIPLSSHSARKFFYRSDLNLSSCDWNQLCPGWSSVGAAGERTLCVKWHNTPPRPLHERKERLHVRFLSDWLPATETAPEQETKAQTSLDGLVSIPALLPTGWPEQGYSTSRSFHFVTNPVSQDRLYVSEIGGELLLDCSFILKVYLIRTYESKRKRTSPTSLIYFFFSVWWDRVLLCCSCWPWTRDSPASAFWVMRLQLCANSLSLHGTNLL